MTPKELKNAILQLAIQGKLVEQRPEEGTAAELYAQIQAEKRALIAAGKLKKEKPLPEIADDEKPFDLPEGWMWVRIGTIFNLQAGKNITSSNIFTENNPEHPYLCYGGNGVRGYVENYNREGHYALIGRQGALCGNINHARGKFYATEHAVVVEQFVDTDVLWCGYFLTALNLNQYATSTAQPGLAVAKINQVLIPLPPLAEQKRIVAKIEELLPLVDRYEKAWSRLEDLNARFPLDMQKALLQTAIQGKLVEQRPEEGTGEDLYKQIQAEKQTLIKSGNLKKEKPLPEIADDEKPFEIPEGWRWVRLLSVVDMLSGYAFKSTDFKPDGKYKLLRGINLGVNAIRWKETVYIDDIPESLDEFKLKKNDVLLGLDRPWISEGVRVAIFENNDDVLLVQRVLRVRETKTICSKYIALILQSTLLKNSVEPETTGISVPHISPKQVGNIAVPLPPLAEQKRIVAKLQELLPLCEKLK